ncbi:MAG TPA: hypothetical protein PL196_01240 [Burkholderiaceae bacterium]|nr:hypothetical protein [Burkholderiaceae bacterium]
MAPAATVIELARGARARAPSTIAYLDPPYSRYFHGLAGRLAARTGGQVLALLSSPAYALYTGGDRQLVWPPGALADPPAAPEGAEHALWSQHADDERFRAVFWHAVAWFKDTFRAQGVRVCLVFSDARPFSLAAAIAARECGVRCLYVERGAFRMRTASLSMQGLNARFSLERARELQDVAGIAADDPLAPRPQEPWLRARFLRFAIGNEWACRRAPQRRLLQHKRFSLLPYVRLALAQWWGAHAPRRGSDATPNAEAAAPVVLVPMQLPADSQFRLHSPFADNQAFLDFVVRQARSAVPHARVLVKRHPMDSARYRLPEGAQWVAGNLTRFYRQRPLVVCINSTVGFEAAARGVPVICFGPSFYTASPAICIAKRGNFAELVASRIGGARDPARGRTLLADVLRWYQAPGDTWGYTDADLDATAEIALQHLRAEPVPQPQRQHPEVAWGALGNERSAPVRHRAGQA